MLDNEPFEKREKMRLLEQEHVTHALDKAANVALLLVCKACVTAWKDLAGFTCIALYDLSVFELKFSWSECLVCLCHQDWDKSIKGRRLQVFLSVT